MALVRRLDRYVFGEFWKLFVVAMLGFPILLDITDLATRLEEYMNRGISGRDLALSYWYWLPDSLFMVLPAAVLVATVFSIAGLTKHSELIAAKASGMSFYRLIAPVFAGALFALTLDLGLSAIAPHANARRSALIKEDLAQIGTARENFVFAGPDGRVYKALHLRTDSAQISGLQIERKGSGQAYPTYLISATSARYDERAHRWTLRDGAMNLVDATRGALLVSFDAATDRQFSMRPAEMMARQREPHDLTFAELGRIIKSTERSGGNADLLRVEQALKIAVPVTCIIIALFGAPLATSSNRGGSAYGVAISLATTMVFLVAVQLTRAIGAKGVLPPVVAAFVPAAIFGAAGLVLLWRVRT